MDALLALSVIIILLAALAATSITFGVDSREGFADDCLRPTLR
jgi:hypothetical protein